MKCYNCGADLPNGSKFCGVCGAQQLKAVPKKRSAGHKVFGIIFVLLFLAIIITALFLVYRVFYKKGDAITYYKGSQLLQKDISKLKKDPAIISEGFSDVTDEFFNSSDLIMLCGELGSA